MAFMEEVHSVVWEKIVVSFKSNSYHMLFEPGLTLGTIRRTQRRVPKFQGKKLIHCFFAVTCPDRQTIYNLRCLPRKNSSNF